MSSHAGLVDGDRKPISSYHMLMKGNQGSPQGLGKTQNEQSAGSMQFPTLPASLKYADRIIRRQFPGRPLPELLQAHAGSC